MMRTIQLIGGPANGEYVAVADEVTIYKIIERLDSVSIFNEFESRKPVDFNVRHHEYRQSPDCDFIFYHCE